MFIIPKDRAHYKNVVIIAIELRLKFTSFKHMLTLRDSLIFDSFGPHDSFHQLARSMRQLSDYADHILGLADAADAEVGQHTSSDASTNGRKRKPAKDASAHLRLPLRPRIDWREDANGFVLTAETPGLRKDELKVELVDASDHCVLEVSGQTAVKPAATDAAKATDADANVGPTDAGKPQELRATYRAFKERVRLPQGVDREAMRAKYEDGLLVVTIPRVKTDGVKRRAIALN